MGKEVVLLGDSITQGLGSKKINFTENLNSLLGDGFHVDNMALTGTTISYAQEILPRIIEKKPDYTIIVYGNVDAQIRPNRNGRIFKHIPKRFQKSGMLMPRPFYSHTWYKRIGQKIDNDLRSFFSWLIYRLDGSEQWVRVETFEEIYQDVVEQLMVNGTKVIACSTVFIDENKFNGSNEQYVKFNQTIRKIATINNIEYIDLYTILGKAVSDYGWDEIYCADHFHPKAHGYEIMANVLANVIGR